MIALVFLLVLSIHTPLFAAQTFYVQQSTGSDSHSCEQAKQQRTAKKSINGCIACMSGGDTCSIGTGTYDELLFGQYTSRLDCASGDAANQTCHVVPNGLDRDRPTRLVGDGTALLSPQRTPVGGGSIFTGYDATRHIHLEGLRFIKHTTSGSAGGVYFGNGQYMTLTRSEVEGGAVKNASVSRYHTITHNDIHHTDPGCDQSTNPQPFCQHGMYIMGQDHIITDNTVSYSAYYGIQVSAEGGGIERIQILRNTVKYSYAVGIRCGGEHCVIGSNLLVGNGTAITMSGSGVVAHNTIDGYNPEGKGDPFGIYLSWGDWSQWTVTDNILTRQKSAYLSINDYQFRTPDAAHVHHNLSDLSGNAGATIIGTPEQVYTNVSQGDYSLKRTKDNPALWAGVPMAQVPTDLRGRPYSTTHPSVGAYALELPQPEPPQPPAGLLTLACQGDLLAAGKIQLQCVQQLEGRR